MGSRTALAVVAVALLPGLGISGCDVFGEDLGRRSEGQSLTVTEYVEEQPASLADYADMGVIGGYSSLFLYDLGSGPDDPPRLVRSIRIPGFITTAAQVDARGYVWVATPDYEEGGPAYVTYIVDPHRAIVQRVIDLPDEIRAVGDLSIYDDGVFLRSWRNGFSGGIGRVDPDCAVDASRCAAELFTELGNVGIHADPPIQRVGDVLYSTSNANSRDERQALDKIDARTGEILISAPRSGGVAIGDLNLFFETLTAPNVWELVKMDLGTLSEVATAPAQGMELIAYQDGLLYRTHQRQTTVEVRDAETLESTGSFSIAEAGGASSTFAFVAPNMLMLNGTAALDVGTGAVLLDPARHMVQMGADPGRMRLPQGHPLGF